MTNETAKIVLLIELMNNGVSKKEAVETILKLDETLDPKKGYHDEYIGWIVLLLIFCGIATLIAMCIADIISFF